MNVAPPDRRADQEQLAEVFSRVQRDEPNAFAEFYEHLSRPLLAYYLSFTRNVDDAQDLFQQTITSIYEHRSRYRDSSIYGWVFTIARNTCRSWERKHKRQVPLERETAEQMIDGSPTAEDREETDLVQQAILGLQEEFREVILLRYFGGFSVKEIAEAKEITESLVKVRLFRARDQLRNELGPLIGPEQ